MAPRSRAQLEDALRRRNCADDLAAAVLDRMTEVGLVDDPAYAVMLVRSRQATRGLAKLAIAHELRAKGIDDEVVQEAVGSITEESERGRAEQHAVKRLRSLQGLDPQIQARRLSGMLARKGYSSGIVYAVVRDAIAAAPEHQRD